MVMTCKNQSQPLMNFRCPSWVAGQMHKTALSSWPKPNCFANQQVRKTEGNNTFLLNGFSKTRCTLKKLPWKAMSCWEVQEGVSPKPSRLWHQNPKWRPRDASMHLSNKNYLRSTYVELTARGCNWADVPIWHKLSLHHQPLLPERLPMAGAEPPTAQGCPEHKPSLCTVGSGFGKHTARLVFRNKTGTWCGADRTSFFRTFSLQKAVLLKLNSGSKYIPVK